MILDRCGAYPRLDMLRSIKPESTNAVNYQNQATLPEEFTSRPEFAAQLLFTPDSDQLIDILWMENPGNIAWRLLNLSMQGLFPQSPQLVLRELLALSICCGQNHASIETPQDRQRLQQTMQQTIGTELQYLCHLQQLEKAEKQLAIAAKTHGYEGLKYYEPINQANALLQQFTLGKPATALLNLEARRYYQNFEQDAFAWLISPHAEVQALIQDGIDTFQMLRCGDAIRQWHATHRVRGLQSVVSL